MQRGFRLRRRGGWRLARLGRDLLRVGGRGIPGPEITLTRALLAVALALLARAFAPWP